MAKDSRFQYEYRKGASKLHKQVGDILRSEVYFKNLKSYQEYPVNKINPDYHTSKEHFDWAILDLKVVIEVMGSQHYKATSWTGDVEDAIENFRGIQRRDFTKRDAALAAGWGYVELPYTLVNQLDGDKLLRMIANAMIVRSNPTTVQQDRLIQEMKILREEAEKQRWELDSLLEQKKEREK